LSQRFWWYLHPMEVIFFCEAITESMSGAALLDAGRMSLVLDSIAIMVSQHEDRRIMEKGIFFIWLKINKGMAFAIPRVLIKFPPD
jgi:hypothetical protein